MRQAAVAGGANTDETSVASLGGGDNAAISVGGRPASRSAQKFHQSAAHFSFQLEKASMRIQLFVFHVFPRFSDTDK